MNTAVQASLPTKPKAAHILVDHNLQFVINHDTISQWAHTGSLAGKNLTEVFPELAGFEEAIFHSPIITIPAIHRLTAGAQEAYFDIQIEPALYLDRMFNVTLIDVTEQTQIRHYLQQQQDHLRQQYQSSRNGDKLDELERHVHSLHLLNQVSRSLVTTLNKQEVIDQLLQLATELIRVEGSSIWLWDEAKPDELECQAVYHREEEPALLGQRLISGQGVGGWAAQAREIVVVHDTSKEKRFFSGIDARTGVHTVSLMAVPLHFHDTSLGVLELVNKADGIFTPEEQAMAETLATFASVAIHNAQLVNDLQISNEELDSFAHTVAHDLQNTLSVVIGFAELLKRDELRLAADKRQQMLEAMVKNTYKMSNILKELLLLASVRKADVTVHPLDMEQVIEATLMRLAYVIEDYDVDIVMPDTWPAAMGYASWVEEIWENYLSNALKYGGEPPRIECGGEVLENGRVRFWVRDNGPGLTAEEQTKLFDPFVQLSKVRIKGSGLGLSIVQRIANKLGGEVGVESKLGQGSLFYFILPGAAEIETVSNH
jgi:signal transduction histidine kinase